MKPFFIGLVVEHLAADPGIGQILPETLQGIEIGSGPTVRTVNFVHRFADDPADALLGASSQQSLVPTKITCRNPYGILQFNATEIRS